MKIVINGETQRIREGSTLSELIKQLDLGGRRLALELNEEVVPRSRFDTTQLSAGDRVEIIHAIGGG